MIKRILLIDDEPKIRRVLRISLLAENFTCLEAATAEEGLEKIRTESPDLVILDLGLPDAEGLDLLCLVRKWSKVPILILSARDAEDEKVKLLENGANDYLSKPFGIKELIARIRVLLRDIPASELNPVPGKLHFKNLDFDLGNQRIFLNKQLLNLSRKEFSVLSYLARHAGELVSQQTLLSLFWGPSHIEDTHYLRILVSQLRKKLNDEANAPVYIETRSGIGYCFLQLPLDKPFTTTLSSAIDHDA